ncbi:hypothetical protein HCN_1291 [Helicobacter cinaedi PAGU611]|nr:hypothetical protein HCN_1291 [Helicobacter cinaedi PAGU611]
MKDIILVDEVTQAGMKHNPCEAYKTAIATTLDEEGYCIRPYSGYKPGQNYNS